MMPYSLRDQTGRGVSGPYSVCLFDDDSKEKRPKIGGQMRVGTPWAATYGDNSLWTTTEIEEIISDKKDMVVFRTRTGSEYVWSEF